MNEQIKRWLSVPVFPGDEDKAQKARVLYALQISILAALLPAALGAFFILVHKALSLSFILAFAFVLISYGLALRGRVLTASRLFVSELWVMVSLLILLTGRFDTAYASLYLAIVVMAGILLGMRSAITFCLLGVLLGLGLALLDVTGYPLIGLFPVPPLASLFAWVISLILSLISLNPTIQVPAHSTETVQQQTYDLDERVKEVNCYYGLSRIIETSGESIEKLMQGTIELLPPFWQYPSITCARIILDGQAFSSPNFQQTSWMLRRPILVKGAQTGSLEVGYLDAKPTCDEDPFLHQEGLLLDVVAERLGKVVEHIRAQQALRESETRYRTLFDTLDAAALIMRGATCIECNSAALRLFGLSNPDELVGKTPLDFAPPTQPNGRDSAEMMEWNLKMALSQNAHLFEWQAIHSSGKPFYMEVRLSPIALGYETLFQCVAWDITERKRAEKDLQTTTRLLMETQRMGKIGSWEYDLATNALSWTPEVYHIFGIDPSTTPTLEGLAKWIHPDDLWVIAPETIEKNTEAGIQEMEYRIVDQTTGEIKHVIGKGETLIGADGSPVKNFGSFQDITERKGLEAELERLATTDPLTGAHNRRQLIHLAEIELRRARRYGHSTSAIMLDIDNFKHVNDTYGHPAGDQALIALAQLLTREVRTIDLVARYGGEEFMLVLPETSLKKAHIIAERIRRTVAETPVMVDGQTIRFTISLGATSSESVKPDFESLLKEADRLLYQAKQSGRNRVVASLADENP